MIERLAFDGLFDRFFSAAIDSAVDTFNERGRVPHAVILLVDGQMEMIPFDEIMGAARKSAPHASEDDLKSASYALCASVIKDQRADCYAEMSEAWMVTVASLAEHDAIKSRYGSLENVPRRLEILFVRGTSAAGERRSKVWEIKRSGSSAELIEFEGDMESGGCKASVLDDAVGEKRHGDKLL